jgi:hypothetical protein
MAWLVFCSVLDRSSRMSEAGEWSDVGAMML